MKRVLFLTSSLLIMAGCSGLISIDQPGGGGIAEGTETGSGTVIDSEVNTSIEDYDESQKATDSSDDIIDKNNSDLYWEDCDFPNEVSVAWSGANVTVGTTNSDIICYTNGGHAVIDMQTNSVEGAVIYVQGTCSDGSVKIYSNKKVLLKLNGMDVTSSRGPVINNQCGKRLFVELADGTVNRMCDSATYGDDIYSVSGDEDRKGCFFSEGNIIVSGTGKLEVTGKNKHGICTDGSFIVRPGATVVVKDAAKNAIHVKGDEDEGTGVRIMGGYIYANSSAAGGKSIKCDMSVEIDGGALDLSTSGGYDTSDSTDPNSAGCIKSDTNISIYGGTIVAKSTGQAGKGIKADGNIIIGLADGSGPDLTIATSGSSYGSGSTKAGPGGWGGGMGGGMGGMGGGGMNPGGSSSDGSSAKAIKAAGTITINGGNISITTKTDGAEGIESKSAVNNSIVINGGDICLNCYDDAINSAGQIVFNGGNTFAYSCGNDSVDSNYGKTGCITINGGKCIAISTKGAPEEGIDADNASLAVTGGYLFTMGAAQSNVPSVPTSSTATQPTALLKSMALTQKQYFTAFDSDSNALFTILIPASLSQNYSVVSCPSFSKGSTYNFYTGSAAPTGYDEYWGYENMGFGFYVGGSVAQGTKKKSVAFSSNYMAI